MTIRWMIRRDMPSVLAIEEASFEFAMNEHDFILMLRRRDTIGMVYEEDEQILGYMAYSLLHKRILVESIAVHPNYRLRGVGRAMFDRLASKLSFQRRNRIDLLVSETNLGALNFFKKLGVRADGLVEQPWTEHGCKWDGISMSFRAKQEAFA